MSLTNPVGVLNPDVVIFDYDSDIYEQLYSGEHLFFKIGNYKFEAIYSQPGSFYSKINLEINNDFSMYLKEYDAIKIDDMFSMMVIPLRIYLDLTKYQTVLRKYNYLTDDEVNEYNNLNKIVAINIKKPLCLTNGYSSNPFILNISEPTITTDKISAIATTDFADIEVDSLNYAPTMVTRFPTISNTKLVLEGSTVINDGQKIIFKPIYSKIGILYPVMTYKEWDEVTYQHKWALDATIKAYS